MEVNQIHDITYNILSDYMECKNKFKIKCIFGVSS